MLSPDSKITRSAKPTKIAKTTLSLALLFSLNLAAAAAAKAAENTDFDLSNDVKNNLLPILIPEQERSDNGELKYNYQFNGYTQYWVRRPPNFNRSGGSGNNTVNFHKTNDHKVFGQSPQLKELGYFDKAGFKKWCLHTSDYTNKTTFLVKTSTNNTESSLKTLHNIINVGAKKDALKNNTPNRGENMTATYSTSNYLVAQGEGNSNGSITVNLNENVSDGIKANIINLAKQDNNKAVRYAKGWGQNDITFKK
ncbi:MAG: hypothetical protein E7K04_04490, partial [Helicobacter sp.]|nr:hypothetical protein [Helicobacter sp.]